ELTAASHSGRTSSSAILAALRRRARTVSTPRRITLSASTTLKRLHVCALSRPLNGTTMRRIRLMERTIRLYRWLRLDPV
ncbi:hypothetical protein GGF37_005692, partial [Kickxella alabastrina]